MVILPVDLRVEVHFPGVGIQGDPLGDGALLERTHDFEPCGLAVADDLDLGHLVQMPILLHIVIGDFPCVPGPGDVLEGGQAVGLLPFLHGLVPGNLVINADDIVVLIEDHPHESVLHHTARLVHGDALYSLGALHHLVALGGDVLHPDLSFFGLHKSAGSKGVVVEHQQAALGPHICRDRLFRRALGRLGLILNLGVD